VVCLALFYKAVMRNTFVQQLAHVDVTQVPITLLPTVQNMCNILGQESEVLFRIWVIRTIQLFSVSKPFLNALNF